MFIGRFCNRSVASARRGSSAVEAAQKMRDAHVGDLVVVEETPGGRRPVGIVTDRDIVVEVVAAGLDPAKVTLGDLLVEPLITLEERADYVDAIELMISKNVRRLPIVDGAGMLIGIITLDDVLRQLALPLAELSDLSARERKRETLTRP